MDEFSKIVDFLIQSGSDINAKYGVFCGGSNVLRTILIHYKDDSNIVNFVKILLEKGVQLKSDGESELHLLFLNYDGVKAFEIAKVLIDNGVDINAKDAIERNALHYLFKFFNDGNRVVVR